MDIKVDDTPTEAYPSTSVGQSFVFETNKPHSASFHDDSIGAMPVSGDIVGTEDFTSVSEERLNSSGEGNLDSLDFDINMVSEDLIQLVGEDLLGPDGDRDIF